MAVVDEYLTTAQAAGELGLAPKTLRNWRTRGGGPPAVKMGAAVRYRRSALERWARERTQDRTPRPDRRAS